MQNMAGKMFKSIEFMFLQEKLNYNVSWLFGQKRKTKNYIIKLKLVVFMDFNDLNYLKIQFQYTENYYR